MINKLLIANRGEVAIRIARAAADLGITSFAVYPQDDARCLHTRIADQAIPLEGVGAAAYLDAQQLITLARQHGCDAIHPGYGFLSEQPDFARRCEAANIRFVGPSADVLARLGNKASARVLAKQCAVPVIPGTDGAIDLEQARAFLANLPAGNPALLKAIAGGGGRGMRILRDANQLEEAFHQCSAEALSAFGDHELYIEEMVARARHIEVQVIGDGTEVSHLWERECSLQRKHQKMLEIAPSPSLSSDLREALIDAALRLARTVGLSSLCTFEFLLDEQTGRFFFIEANPRLQVEHTITEAVTGIDLVQAQLRLAGGETLRSLHLQQADIPPAQGFAMQLRINMESMQPDGSVLPSGGTLSIFEPPGGPGIRVDSFGYAGYSINPRYDSLLAKLIVHSPSGSFSELAQRVYRTLCQTRIQGVETNIEFLKNLLCHPAVVESQVYTRFIDEHLGQLIRSPSQKHPQQFFTESSGPAPTAHPDEHFLDGLRMITAPMSGLLIELHVAEDQPVHKGQALAMIESMKMQHVISAPASGIIRRVSVDMHSAVTANQALLYLQEADVDSVDSRSLHAVDLDTARADLSEVLSRHALGQDASRPQAVARRHAKGKRTARENIADLCDADSFIEYGALTFAAQRSRFSEQELAISTPADGLIAGVASVNGNQFQPQQARCMVLAYDYTVLAGTQGIMSHKKLSRMLGIANELEIPLIIYAEGGGGRPGDSDDATRATGLNMPSFLQFAQLSGLAPRISIVSGRCFAGNAVLAGGSDILIATQDANVGMAGPAMIEGAGLGVHAPEDIGPVNLQAKNGVIDCVVDDEAQATALAKKLLGYFQGSLEHWESADQRALRHSVPDNRLRSYDMWSVIETLSDSGSAIQLREQFAANMITALIRIEGRSLGVIANNPRILGGAIDTDAADKASRFLQLCDAFDLPVLSLCDTPGFMVGPENEKTALVRHSGRIFAVAANMATPMFSLILRKGYGLGAMAMTGGSFHAPLFIASWPTGEFGGMGFEGAVRLAYRDELEAIADQQERKLLFDKLVNDYYQRGKASSVAASLEFDAVIDPATSRQWLVRCLQSLKTVGPRQGKRRPFIDTW
ncbi:biotin/lipoyl-binding protein [Pseudomonas sp. BN414]|uniref:carboxyl transferase domain-containing protein n=1 Tax=unclassified Pseudomonas TaxID=196821 RepID=UPI002454868D|nr:MULTISPECIES: carboxyl transferase domain-containing protein [unclassified Pseudomonas]MDH4566263.1 biotin/lipoyl-binding protein [Pseudomonas sp. BN414]MDH4581951.1 biotin/lipoyl-binding protein [Pseudomonas sp. BN415]